MYFVSMVFVLNIFVYMCFIGAENTTLNGIRHGVYWRNFDVLVPLCERYTVERVHDTHKAVVTVRSLC